MKRPLTNSARSNRRLRDITGARFRASPNYQLIPFDHLPDKFRLQLGESAERPGFYGLLLPSKDWLTPKTACEDTALLFYTLVQPGPLPSFVRAKFRDDAAEAIAQLVLDGILEISTDPDELFVSGPEACSMLFEDASEGAGGSRLARLTDEALYYGAQLRTLSVSELSARLYAYNVETATAARRCAFQQAAGTLSFLGLNGSVKTVVRRRGWRVANAVSEGWVFFSSPRAGFSPYKLYLSPRFDELANVFGAIVDGIVSSRAVAFKVGGELSGLLRPDKIVAYCESFEDLAALADCLEQRLQGCLARGVPFTAQIDKDGLLSWGMDPPRENQTAGLQQRESWRFWLTNRLAISLAEVNRLMDASGAVRFALDRLRLEGVDTETWTPKQAIWRTA